MLNEADERAEKDPLSLTLRVLALMSWRRTKLSSSVRGLEAEPRSRREGQTLHPKTGQAVLSTQTGTFRHLRSLGAGPAFL